MSDKERLDIDANAPILGVNKNMKVATEKISKDQIGRASCRERV